MHYDARSEHAHHHVFLGEAHAANERRTRYVVGLTAAMMVVEIVTVETHRCAGQHRHLRAA